jgi:hypothetical protein
MKRIFAPTTLVVVFATMFVLGIVPRAQAGEDKECSCSNATLRGSFGFNSSPPRAILPERSPECPWWRNVNDTSEKTR